MDFWLDFLPIIIYVLLIILLIVGIVLGVKAIITMNKVEKVVDNVNEKFETLNPLFNLIDFTTDRLANLSDSLVDLVTGMVSKLFFKKEKKMKEEDEDNE